MSKGLQSHVKQSMGLRSSQTSLGPAPNGNPIVVSTSKTAHRTVQHPWTGILCTVVRTVEEAADRTYDYIICAFKCLPDVITTPTLLAPLIQGLSKDDSTSFVLLQNGIGIDDDLQEALEDLYAKTAVISGCAWVDVTALDGGRTVTQFGTERLVLGCHAGRHSPPSEFGKQSLQTFCDILRSAGATAVAADDIDVARWRKVLWCVHTHRYSLQSLLS